MLKNGVAMKNGSVDPRASINLTKEGFCVTQHFYGKNGSECFLAPDPLAEIEIYSVAAPFYSSKVM